MDLIKSTQIHLLPSGSIQTTMLSMSIGAQNKQVETTNCNTDEHRLSKQIINEKCDESIAIASPRVRPDNPKFSQKRAD